MSYRSLLLLVGVLVTGLAGCSPTTMGVMNMGRETTTGARLLRM